MKVWELDDPVCRFRLAHCSVGLVGCLCVAYAVWTPRWLGDQGLWTEWNDTENDQTGDVNGHTEDNLLFHALEAERFFGVVSFLMAVSSGALCLVFALCWTSQTVRSYSNTRSLLMAGQALYPTTLLLLTLGPTGFFFLLSWSLFTYQHWEDISQDFTCLGSSYWLGVLGWALLLVVLPFIFLVEQCIVPDILPDLIKAAESWRRPTALQNAIRSFSEGYGHGRERDDSSLRRVMSVP